MVPPHNLYNGSARAGNGRHKRRERIKREKCILLRNKKIIEREREIEAVRFDGLAGVQIGWMDR